MKKAQKQGARAGRRAAETYSLQVVVLVLPGKVPIDMQAMPENSPFTEISKTIYLWILHAWEACQAEPSPVGGRPTGRLGLELVFAKKPRLEVSDEYQLLEAEVTERVLRLLRRAEDQPQPIDLPFVRGKLTFQPLPGLDSSAVTSDTSTIANTLETGQVGGEGIVEPLLQEDLLPSPEEEPEEKGQPGLVERAQRAPIKPQEIIRGGATVEQLQADLAGRLKGLIPTLSADPEQKAAAIIALNRTINLTYWQELRNEAEPLIKSLLENIPADYEGKRRRATLLNALLIALDRGILIHDQQGQPHVCSVQPVRGRETDEKGYLRLQEKSTSGSSRKNYPIPPLDEIQIIETPHQESDPQPHPTRSRRGG
jgi:hypothetical protein